MGTCLSGTTPAQLRSVGWDNSQVSMGKGIPFRWFEKELVKTKEIL